MKKLINDTRIGFMIWKLAIGKVLLMSFATGIATFQTAMSGGVKWDSLDGTDQVLVILGVISAMAGVVIAFLDKTIARIEGKIDEEVPAVPASEPKP